MELRQNMRRLSTRPMVWVVAILFALMVGLLVGYLVASNAVTHPTSVGAVPVISATPREQAARAGRSETLRKRTNGHGIHLRGELVMRRFALLAVLGSLGILAAVMSAGSSLATAPSGAGATFTHRAAVDPYHFDSNDYKIFQKDREDVVIRQFTIAPGGNNGWHLHPGPSIVIVTQGTLSLYEANDPTCTAKRLAVGVGFTEAPGDVHIARNEGNTPVVGLVTFLDVPVGGAFRLDAPRPGNCPF